MGTQLRDRAGGCGVCCIRGRTSYSWLKNSSSGGPRGRPRASARLKFESIGERLGDRFCRVLQCCVGEVVPVEAGLGGRGFENKYSMEARECVWTRGVVVSGGTMNFGLTIGPPPRDERSMIR